MKSARLLAAGLAVFELGACGIAAAQSQLPQPPLAGKPKPATLAEVVVTARRRAENLENVPATVAVLSAQALESRGIQTQADLQTVVPGLVVRTVQNQNMLNFVLRGESLDAYSGSVPGVQPYIDDVPISANNAAAFYDLQSIQVLKGPQGTLFGRNSTGGAVLVTTAQPTADYGGNALVSYGNYDTVRSEAAVNLPIVGNTVLARFAGDYDSGGAFVHNLYDGKDYGDTGETSGRFTLLVRPTDGFSNTTTLEYSRFSGTNAPLLPGYVVPCGVPGPGNACKWTPTDPLFNQLIDSPTGTYLPGYPNGYVFPGGLAALPGFLRSQGRYVVDACCSFTHIGSNEFIDNTTTLGLPQNLSLKNIFGFSTTHSGNAYSDSETPYPILLPGGNAPGGSELEDLRTRTVSDELQLQGKALASRLTYILGVFYVDERDENNSPLTGIALVPAYNLIVPFNLRYHSYNEDESRAIYAQGSYALTHKLNLTLGARGTKDDLGIHQTPDSTLKGPALHTTESNPSWTASLDYHFTADLMAYAVTRGSWRVGGYDPFIAGKGDTTTAEAGGSYFLPEKVHDVEIGAKFTGRLAGIPTQINLDAFNQWNENLQKSASVLLNGENTSATTNIPAGEVSGLEGDFELLPIDWLRLGGAFSLQDARFTDNRASLYGLDVTFGPYPDVPRYSGSIFGEITQHLGGAGKLLWHADVFAESRQYYGSLGALTPDSVIPGYLLINARLDWADPIGIEGATLSLFVKNMANRFYFTGGNASAQGNGLEYADMGEPRTYGFVARYDF